MVANGTNGQANVCAEEKEMHTDQNHDGNVENDVLLEQHRADKGKMAQRTPRGRWQAQVGGQGIKTRIVWGLHKQEKVRQAQRDNIDRDTTDHLVSPKVN